MGKMSLDLEYFQASQAGQIHIPNQVVTTLAALLICSLTVGEQNGLDSKRPQTNRTKYKWSMGAWENDLVE